MDEFRIIRKLIIIGIFSTFIYLIFPFLDCVAYATALSYMALPIFNFFNRYMGRTLSALLAIAFYIVPIIAIFIYFLITLINIVLELNPEKLTNMLYSFYHNYYNFILLNSSNFINEKVVMSYIDKFVGYIINLISSKILDFGVLGIKILLIIFFTFYFLRDGYYLKNIIYDMTPEYYKEKIKIYLYYLHESYKNLFISNVNISVIIGVLSYIGYKIFGIPYAELLAILTGIFAFLPIVGGWTIYVPLAVYIALTGNLYKGIALLIYGQIFLSFAPDFIIRPYLVNKDTDIHPALVIIAFLISPLTIGFVGFALGPIVVGALHAFYLAKYKYKKI